MWSQLLIHILYTTRHLVLDPIFIPIVPIVVPMFVRFILFTLLSLVSNSHIVRAPDFEIAASIRWIGLFLSRLRRWQLSYRLFPCRVKPQICAPVARLPVCTSPAVSVIPIRVRPLCVFFTSLCFLRAFVPLHLVKSFLPFLAVMFTLSFVPSSCLCPCLCLSSLCPCLCLGLPLPFVVRARPSTCLAVLQVFVFFFSTVSPCDCQFHTMNSFLGTFDLGCPSPTNPSVQAVCFFVLGQRFRSFFANFVHGP